MWPNGSRRSLLLRSAMALAGGVLLPPALIRPASAGGAAGSAGPAPLAQAPPSPAARGMVRLLANENPYGPAASARRAMIDSLGEVWQYPVGREQALKKMIAEREGLSPQQVMIADGSGEILRIAGLVFGAGNGEVVAAKPTFSFLQDYARQRGGTIREVPLDTNFRHDLDAMAKQVSDRTSLVYVCNPNNPTGTLLTGAQLRPFVREIAKKTTVLVDEAYLDLWNDLKDHTVKDCVASGDAVIVTRTFSKLHGLAGLRIGYALARPDLIQRLEQNRMSLLNLAGLMAATASYQDLGFQAFSRDRLHEGLDISTAELRELKLPHVEGGRGNFVFFDTGGSLPDFSAAMRREGFLVGRPFPPYMSWCRVSMGTVEQMRGFAGALRRSYATIPDINRCGEKDP